MARVVATEDAGFVLDAARSTLEREPVANNLVLTLLERASASPIPGTFWLVRDDRGEARAVALRWPASMPAALGVVPVDLVGALVEGVARSVPDLRGVGGDVVSASAFAGAWVEQCHRGAAPVEGQRIHRLVGDPKLPPVAGILRRATATDVALVRGWMSEFGAETGDVPSSGDSEQRIADGEVWLWDVGAPVAMAAARPPVAGVSRVGPVYTPPELRNRGYAGAAVGALSTELLSTVATTCILYTQLSNPVSNSVYRRIGYRPVIEVLRYELGN